MWSGQSGITDNFVWSTFKTKKAFKPLLFIEWHLYTGEQLKSLKSWVYPENRPSSGYSLILLFSPFSILFILILWSYARHTLFLPAQRSGAGTSLPPAGGPRAKRVRKRRRAEQEIRGQEHAAKKGFWKSAYKLNNTKFFKYFADSIITIRL